MNIVVRSLSDQIYDTIRHRILTGSMAPGIAMRQDNIAAELGVSKIPLREAFSRLEQDGLLSSYPNRGYIVRPLSADEAEEVFALRLKLEPSAVAQACLKARPDDHAVTLAALNAMENSPQTEILDCVTLNREFHLALIRPAGPVTTHLLERLYIIAERYVRMHLDPVGRDLRATSEHKEIFQAWCERDAAKVEILMIDHIRSTLTDLEQQLG